MWEADHSTQPSWLGELVIQGAEAMGAFDAAGRLVYLNAAGAELLGSTREALLGADVFSLVHPEDLARAAANIGGVADGARPRSGLIRLRHGDGTWVTLEVRPSLIETPPPPDGLGPVTAVVLRDTALQDAHWHFLAALSRGDPFEDCMRTLAEGLSLGMDGPMAITFDDGGLRRCEGPLPPALAGVTPDGGLDATAGTPWAAALRSGRPEWIETGDLPESLRAPAHALGAAACVVVPVPDPGSGRPAMIVQWPAHQAMAELLAEALTRRPRQAVTLALDRRDALRRLEHLAHHDDLSGLVNRARFFAQVADLATSGTPFGVCYIDLDQFKPVNDTLGHVVGDHTIIVVAQRLRRVARSADVVARLGGDEFAVAIAGAEASTVEDLAQQIVDVLGQPCRIGEHLVKVGASVGCAHSTGRDAGEAVVAAADAALYEAKRAGRGTWRRATEIAPVTETIAQPSLPWMPPVG